MSAPTKRSSLGGQFRQQLTKLVETLKATDPHFIRCIKPNSQKEKRVFDAPMTLTQLRYAGVFEAVAIRKSGYPFRMTLLRFTHWFKCLLLPRTNKGYTPSRTFKLAAFESADPRERAQQILTHTGQLWANVQIGKSLILYRAEEHRLLELLRSLALSVLVPYLQRIARGHLARECRRRCIQTSKNLTKALTDVTCLQECDAAASAHGKLMGGYAKLFSPYIKEIRQLRTLRSAFEEWVKLERELEAALAKYVIADDENEEEAFAGVESAMIHAEQLREVVGTRCTPFQLEIYGHARSIVDANAAARLGPMAEEALWLLDKQKMEYVKAEAVRVAFTNKEVSEILHLLSLPEEKLVEMQLKKAVELQDPKRVQNREVRLRDLYVAKFHRLYEITAFPRLRSPMEWAEAKGTKLAKVVASRSATEARAARMLEHASKPLHISLTDIDNPALNKEAITLFKCLLAWGGEKADPLPAAQAYTLLKAAADHIELRPELYVQVLKQLSGCENAEASTRYWELLSLLLMCAAPGAGVEDFVHAYCLKHANELMRKRLIAQVHKARYNEGMLTEVPPPERLLQTARAFFGGPLRASSRFSGRDLISQLKAVEVS